MLKPIENNMISKLTGYTNYERNLKYKSIVERCHEHAKMSWKAINTLQKWWGTYLFLFKWSRHLKAMLIGRKGVWPFQKKLIPMTSPSQLMSGPPIKCYNKELVYATVWYQFIKYITSKHRSFSQSKNMPKLEQALDKQLFAPFLLSSSNKDCFMVKAELMNHDLVTKLVV